MMKGKDTYEIWREECDLEGGYIVGEPQILDTVNDYEQAREIAEEVAVSAPAYVQVRVAWYAPNWHSYSPVEDCDPEIMVFMGRQGE